jgi:GR25 family glycosyltransferase involved in LPS biosynthesis
MIKIFVISLSNEKERQNYIQSFFDAKGASFEFLFGVDGRKLSQEEINSFHDAEKAKKYGGELSRGEIGCALSHRLVYERMVKNNIERAIIMEDDIKLKNDFFIISDLLEKIPINNFIIKLDKFYSTQTGDDNSGHTHFTPWHRIALDKEYNIRQPLRDPTLTWGYYIDIKAAYTLFYLSQKIFVVADAWYYFKYFIKLRMINKALVDNEAHFESIIGTRIKSKTKKRAYNQYKKTNANEMRRRIIKKMRIVLEIISKIFH